MAETELVTTPRCMVCGKQGALTVDRARYERWVAGEFIQNALPELTADEREQLITGTHGPCWDEMFTGEED